VLLGLAATAVINIATTIDWHALWNDLSDAAWGWIVVGFVLTQLARLTQATSSLGSIAADIPFGRVYMKQLATSYLNWPCLRTSRQGASTSGCFRRGCRGHDHGRSDRLGRLHDRG
jgi:hypothetical protein